MRFRRKSERDDVPIPDDAEDSAADSAGQPAPPAGTDGPYDSAELDSIDDRVDLGSLLLVPVDGQELRVQVDDASGQVQSVVLAGPDGALDLRAFAAPRNGDLWGEVRPKIAADLAQNGALADERDGPFGAELMAQVGTGQGNQTQITRIIGVNGPRWLLRATLYGRPALEPETASEWEDTIRRVAVHRGNHAVPPGEALPVTLPAQARRVDQVDESADQSADPGQDG